MVEEKTLKDYIVAILLASLFIVSVYKFAVGIGDNYEQDLTVDSNQLDLTKIEQEINQSKKLAEDWQTSFSTDNSFVDNGIIVLKSFVGVVNSVMSAIGIFFNLFLQGLGNVLGLNIMVTGTILAVLILGVIFAAYKVIKQG